LNRSSNRSLWARIHSTGNGSGKRSTRTNACSATL
jgi:hypothetical protein